MKCHFARIKLLSPSTDYAHKDIKDLSSGNVYGFGSGSLYLKVYGGEVDSFFNSSFCLNEKKKAELSKLLNNHLNDNADISSMVVEHICADEVYISKNYMPNICAIQICVQNVAVCVGFPFLGNISSKSYKF